MKEIRLASLSGTLLFAALLNAQQKTVFYHTEASAAQTARPLPVAPQWPCTVSALNGTATLGGQAIDLGGQVSAIDGLQFTSTRQVLVLTDRYQRNFYVTPRTRHFNDTGISCGGPNADCTPVVRDNMGTVVYVAPENTGYGGYDAYVGTTPKGGDSPDAAYRPVTHSAPGQATVANPAPFVETYSAGTPNNYRPFVETTVATPAPVKAKYKLLMPKQ